MGRLVVARLVLDQHGQTVLDWLTVDIRVGGEVRRADTLADDLLQDGGHPLKRGNCVSLNNLIRTPVHNLITGSTGRRKTDFLVFVEGVVEGADGPLLEDLRL